MGKKDLEENIQCLVWFLVVQMQVSFCRAESL